MSAGDEYRLKAAKLAARAKQERHLLIRAELESLALAYMRLADQADRNAMSDIVYETPSRQPNLQQQRQQQQQQQRQEPDTDD